MDVAAHLLRHAAVQSTHLALRWVLTQAVALPLADQTVDRVLMSLVLLQIADRQQALREVSRVTSRRARACENRGPRGGLTGLGSVPLFSRVAQVKAARLPAIDAILTVCQQAGFRELRTRMVCRNALVIGCPRTPSLKTASATLSRSGASR